jgi:hypothetical protein
MKIKNGGSRTATENVSVHDRSPPKLVASDGRQTTPGNDFLFAGFSASVKSGTSDIYLPPRREPLPRARPPFDIERVF